MPIASGLTDAGYLGRRMGPTPRSFGKLMDLELLLIDGLDRIADALGALPAAAPMTAPLVALWIRRRIVAHLGVAFLG